MKIIMLGAPGSGKGTQSKLISAKTGLAHISTGDMLRAEVNKGSELGKKIEYNMKNGILVSDDLINAVVKVRLAQDDIKDGYILDGYPRTLAQAQAFDNIDNIDYAINIDVDENALVTRITNRQSCENCKSPFAKREGVTTCPICGGKLIQRPDDNEQTVVTRLKEYNKLTKPLIDFYAIKGKLQNVDGNLSQGEVFKQIEKIINQKEGQK